MNKHAHDSHAAPRRASVTGPLAVLVALSAIAWPAAGFAQARTAADPTSWLGQLTQIGEWMRQHSEGAECTTRCFALERLRLTGNVDEGSIEFELHGSLARAETTAVPLFGPPNQIRIDHATENGRPAAIGFEDDHYYLSTSSPRFVVRGTLHLGSDRALTIEGPLNTLDADLTSGRLVEGPRLSGLAGTTVHFESSHGSDAAAQPAIFQLSRAIRVGREVQFEYRLSMRSGSDLGMVRVPLSHGERPIDVQGAAEWRQEQGAVVLTLEGRTADVTLRGTLPRLDVFGADERSGYEWWLVESDPEHRLTIESDARPMDPTQSPIGATQVSSRLYLLRPGQHLRVSVQTLDAVEVLAAVVRSHARNVIVTRRGEIVSDEWLEYDNNGIDYLTFSPTGRAVFLATDGNAERVLQGSRRGDVMIPLRTGSHTAHLQSLARAHLGWFGGRLEIPAPTHSLTTSRSRVTIGLPRFVHPLLLVGGDRTRVFVASLDVAAVLAALLLAWLVTRNRTRRVLGGVSLAGIWFVSPTLYVLAIVGTLGLLVGRNVVRFTTGRTRIGALAGLAIASILAVAWATPRATAQCEADRTRVAALAAGDNDGDRMREGRGRVADMSNSDARLRNSEQSSTLNVRYGQFQDVNPGENNDGNVLRSLAGDFAHGVTPVALPLPGHDRGVSVSRDLLTRGAAFRPTLYYVTDWALVPFALAWLLALVLLARGCRADVALLWLQVRAKIGASAPANTTASAPDVGSPA